MAWNISHPPWSRILLPPGLILRQAAALASYAAMTGWSRSAVWVWRHGLRTLPVAAGAIGMGCIGYPPHPAWEVTNRCNLRCLHCHADGGEGGGPDGRQGSDELGTVEGKRLIDELRRVPEFRTLVYTGGEPLVREDLFDLMDHAAGRGFVNILATNGTLVTDAVARDLRRHHAAAAAVSLDGASAAVHDAVRAPGAFLAALRGIEAIRRAGIPLQINCTATSRNFADLANVIDLADACGAGILLMYQVVGVGRASTSAHSILDGTMNEELMTLLAAKQKSVRTLLEPVAGPQYWAQLLARGSHGGGRAPRLSARLFHGCGAGRGFVYIKADGEVWPCPFVGISGGNARHRPFPEIWRNGEVFRLLRNRERLLEGRCGDCRWRAVCGGCRGRALAATGNVMAEDPSCFIRNRPESPGDKGES